MALDQGGERGGGGGQHQCARAGDRVRGVALFRNHGGEKISLHRRRRLVAGGGNALEVRMERV